MMKRTILATVTLMFALAGLAAAQSADEDYLKAMQISDNCAKVQALDAYISKYAGQGTTNEHWAYAYYCLTPCSSKSAQKAAEYGEKAIGMPGIDEQTKLGLMVDDPRTITTASGRPTRPTPRPASSSTTAKARAIPRRRPSSRPAAT